MNSELSPTPGTMNSPVKDKSNNEEEVLFHLTSKLKTGEYEVAGSTYFGGVSFSLIAPAWSCVDGQHYSRCLGWSRSSEARSGGQGHTDRGESARGPYQGGTCAVLRTAS